VDFIQKRFFVQVMIQDKTEEGLNAAIAFARSISDRIQRFAYTFSIRRFQQGSYIHGRIFFFTGHPERRVIK